MAFPESVDTFADVRNTEAFKALTKHGITERLAFAWLQERGEQAMLDLVKYTEGRDEQKLIKTSTRTYITSLVKAGADVGLSEYDKEKAKTQEAKAAEGQSAAREKRIAELKAEYETARNNAARSALTPEEWNTHAQAWLATPEGQSKGGKGYDAAKGRFKDAIADTDFKYRYLPKVLVAPSKESEFIVWIRDVKKFNLAKLGLEG